MLMCYMEIQQHNSIHCRKPCLVSSGHCLAQFLHLTHENGQILSTQAVSHPLSQLWSNAAAASVIPEQKQMSQSCQLCECVYSMKVQAVVPSVVLQQQ